jgi:predicted aspartyl protease
MTRITPPKVRRLRFAPAIATALLLATTSFAAQAGCTYKKLGSIPAAWTDWRLMVDGSVNGQRMKMAVDTGAEWTTLSSDLATRLGVALGHTDRYVVGLGGKSEISVGRLEELTIGHFQRHNPRVAVAWREAGLPDVLLGADLLLQVDVELNDHEIGLFTPSACEDAPLAYWADDVPSVPIEASDKGDLRVNITVLVNGKPVRALVDTGMPSSMLDTAAARRLGANPDQSHAKWGGIGGHAMEASAATFDSIAIGPEIVRHVRLRVGDLWQGMRDDVHEMGTAGYLDGQNEMLLGADFIRSHRLLFATSQRRLYFSYLGGEVFSAPPPEPAASR